VAGVVGGTRCAVVDRHDHGGQPRAYRERLCDKHAARTVLLASTEGVACAIASEAKRVDGLHGRLMEEDAQTLQRPIMACGWPERVSPVSAINESQ